MAQGQDWHPEDVKAAIRKTGMTLFALSEQFGVHRTAVSMTLTRPYPKMERRIAEYLGHAPQDIWPSRYDAAGNPLNGPLVRPQPNHSGRAPWAHRQKDDAA